MRKRAESKAPAPQPTRPAARESRLRALLEQALSEADLRQPARAAEMLRDALALLDAGGADAARQKD